MSGMQEALAYGAAGVLSLGAASAAEASNGTQESQAPQHINPTKIVSQEVTDPLNPDSVINLTAIPNPGGGFTFENSTQEEQPLATSSQSSESPDILKNVSVTFKNDGKRNSTTTMSDLAESKVTILQNFSAKPLPRKVVKRLRKQGKCETFDGTEVEIWTAGHNTNGDKKYGRDYRTSEFCRYAGKWVRVTCKNPSLIERKPPVTQTIPGKVVFVNNAAKTSAKLHAEATAQAACVVDGATASAIGRASADSQVKLSTVIKTAKSGASSIGVKLYEQAYQKASAKASAEAHCESSNNGESHPNPTPEEPKPVVTVENLQHLGTNMIARVCEFETAPAGKTIVKRAFSIPAGNVNIISPIYPGLPTGQEGTQSYCIDIQGGAVASKGNIVRASIEASNGTTASDDSNPFEVVDETSNPPLPK